MVRGEKEKYKENQGTPLFPSTNGMTLTELHVCVLQEAVHPYTAGTSLCRCTNRGWGGVIRSF